VLTPDITHEVSVRSSAGHPPWGQEASLPAFPLEGNPAHLNPSQHAGTLSKYEPSSTRQSLGQRTLPAAAFKPHLGKQIAPVFQQLAAGLGASGVPTSSCCMHGGAGNTGIAKSHPEGRQKEARLPVGACLFGQGACFPIRILT